MIISCMTIISSRPVLQAVRDRATTGIRLVPLLPSDSYTLSISQAVRNDNLRRRHAARLGIPTRPPPEGSLLAPPLPPAPSLAGGCYPPL